MKLTIELVPSTSWFSNVRSHVAPYIWNRLRRECYRLAKHCCEVCGGRGPKWPVEAHEIWEYDDVRKIQKLVGLIALCPACHRVKHAGLAEMRGMLKEVAAHLAHVNQISLQDAMLYLEGCFETWARRSQHQWNLDLSYLRQLGVEITNDLSTKPVPGQSSSPFSSPAA